jgi:hypothetical protein
LDGNICRAIPDTPPSLYVPATVPKNVSFAISWGVAANATGYILERYCQGGWTQIYDGAGTSASDRVVNCTFVMYRVKAYNMNTDIVSLYITSGQRVI